MLPKEWTSIKIIKIISNKKNGALWLINIKKKKKTLAIKMHN